MQPWTCTATDVVRVSWWSLLPSWAELTFLLTARPHTSRLLVPLVSRQVARWPFFESILISSTQLEKSTKFNSVSIGSVLSCTFSYCIFKVVDVLLREPRRDCFCTCSWSVANLPYLSSLSWKAMPYRYIFRCTSASPYPCGGGWFAKLNSNKKRQPPVGLARPGRHFGTTTSSHIAFFAVLKAPQIRAVTRSRSDGTTWRVWKSSRTGCRVWSASTQVQGGLPNADSDHVADCKGQGPHRRRITTGNAEFTIDSTFVRLSHGHYRRSLAENKEANGKSTKLAVVIMHPTIPTWLYNCIWLYMIVLYNSI